MYDFTPGLTPAEAPVWLAGLDQASNEQLLMFTAAGEVFLDSEGRVPAVHQMLPMLEQTGLDESKDGWLRLGSIGDQSYLLDLSWHSYESLTGFVALRSLNFGALDPQFLMLGRAFHVLQWHHESLFSGISGLPMQWCVDELAKIGPEGNRIYPVISPAVIVAVEDNDRILLAKAPGRSFYSLIAGFVEPGETVEQAVIREVREETGLEICNLQYLGSQPWPFPHSLMLGYRAQMAGGVLKPDPTEIESIRWFSLADLPEVPRGLSIASDIIRHVMSGFKE